MKLEPGSTFDKCMMALCYIWCVLGASMVFYCGYMLFQAAPFGCEL